MSRGTFRSGGVKLGMFWSGFGFDLVPSGWVGRGWLVFGPACGEHVVRLRVEHGKEP